MKETFYFSHDYNSRSDEKIKKLMRKHWFIGYGVFWGIVEDLYMNANALRLDYECISFDYRVDENIIKSIIEDFWLFIIKDGVISSKSVWERLKEREEKSAKARDSAYNRWGKKDANAMRTHCDGNAIKERKGKENKYMEDFLKKILDEPLRNKVKEEIRLYELNHPWKFITPWTLVNMRDKYLQ